MDDWTGYSTANRSYLYESIIVDNNVESVMLIAFAFENVISNNFIMNYFLYNYYHGLQIT
ncbi:hypothetical protein EPM97_05360 [Salmonella enterica subsp. enterica serovar Cerro]|nr:hypothetical protein [Salmonella enterica subsp. enterica serovar Cerro]